jgi:hypothetical protein
MYRKTIIYSLILAFMGGPLYACRLQGSDLYKLYRGEPVYTGAMAYSIVGHPPKQRIHRKGKVVYKEDSPRKHWSANKVYTGTESDVHFGKAQCTYRAGSYVFTLNGDITKPPKKFKCPNIGGKDMLKELSNKGTELYTKWGKFNVASKTDNFKKYTSLQNPPRITGKFGNITSKFSHSCEFRFTRKWKTYALKVKGSSY